MNCSELLFRRYEKELKAINQLPEPERTTTLWSILERQGEFPRDRAWPTEGGNEPLPEEEWDPSGTHHLETVHQIYSELVAAGKLPA